MSTQAQRIKALEDGIKELRELVTSLHPTTVRVPIGHIVMERPQPTVAPPAPPVEEDGTIVANLVPNVMEAAPPEFVVGAIVQRNGVLWERLVVSAVTPDDGIVTAKGDGPETFQCSWKFFTVLKQ